MDAAAGSLITTECSWSATSNSYITDFCIFISILIHSFKKAKTGSTPQINAQLIVRTHSNIQISHNQNFNPMLYKILTSFPWLCLYEQRYMSCGVTN